MWYFPLSSLVCPDFLSPLRVNSTPCSTDGVYHPLAVRWISCFFSRKEKTAQQLFLSLDFNAGDSVRYSHYFLQDFRRFLFCLCHCLYFVCVLGCFLNFSRVLVVYAMQVSLICTLFLMRFCTLFVDYWFSNCCELLYTLWTSGTIQFRHFISVLLTPPSGFRSPTC